MLRADEKIYQGKACSGKMFCQNCNFGPDIQNHHPWNWMSRVLPGAGRQIVPTWKFPEVTGQTIGNSEEERYTLYFRWWSSLKPYTGNNLQLPATKRCKVRTLSAHDGASKLITRPDRTVKQTSHYLTFFSPDDDLSFLNVQTKHAEWFACKISE